MNASRGGDSRDPTVAVRQENRCDPRDSLRSSDSCCSARERERKERGRERVKEERRRQEENR